MPKKPVVANFFHYYLCAKVEYYDPYTNPVWRAVLDGGVPELLHYAESQNIHVDTSDCRSTCGVCREVVTAIKARELI